MFIWQLKLLTEFLKTDEYIMNIIISCNATLSGLKFVLKVVYIAGPTEPQDGDLCSHLHPDDTPYPVRLQ